MQKTYFTNQGMLPVEMITTMGVSVKVNKSPIGFFGTGLKYAIATILRLGGDIKIVTVDKAGNHVELTFEKRSEEIRGENFDVVYMNGERLPFTTQMGRRWEMWQAYRELHSNCLDENGTITDQDDHLRRDTVITVYGDAFHREYQRRDQLFISGDPICETNGLQIFHGESEYVYYRGVRAGELPKKSRFTYNITSHMELTEDRNFKSLWDVEWRISNMLPMIRNTNFQSGVMRSPDHWDGALRFNTSEDEVAPEFFNAVEDNRSNAKTNSAAINMLERKEQRSHGWPACPVSDELAVRLKERLMWLSETFGCTLTLDDVSITEALGPGIWGAFHIATRRVYIAKQTLEGGGDMLDAVILEEWFHHTHHHDDEAREFQNFIMMKLIHHAKRAAR